MAEERSTARKINRKKDQPQEERMEENINDVIAGVLSQCATGDMAERMSQLLSDCQTQQPTPESLSQSLTDIVRSTCGEDVLTDDMNGIMLLFVQDIETFSAWAISKGPVHVYRTIKIISNILGEYVLRKDATLFRVMKDVLPYMKTDLYELYVSHAQNQEPIETFVWIGLQFLFKMIDDIKEAYKDDDTQVLQIFANARSQLPTIAQTLEQLGFQIPPEFITIIMETLDKFTPEATHS